MTKSAPFTLHEKHLLTQAITPYKSLVESKLTDAVSIVKKKEAWNTIASNFNSNAGVPRRDHVQLKRCWEKLKSATKKQIGQEKRERMATGGGPGPKFIEDDILGDVIDIAPHIDSELRNPFDSQYQRENNSVVVLDVSGSSFVEMEGNMQTVPSIIMELEPDTNGAVSGSPQVSVSGSPQVAFPDSPQVRDGNKRKRPFKDSVESESDLRQRKLREAIAHQQELHAITKACQLSVNELEVKTKRVLLQKERLQLKKEKILLEAEKRRIAQEEELRKVKLEKSKLKLYILRDI